jgi:hypothetical protein
MNTANNNSNSQDYNQPNDQTTFMTDEEKIINKLEADGFTDQFRVEKKLLRSTADPKKSYKPKEIKAVNFYRYEGISDPDDMSIIYAIETCDGRKGTLVDAYGRYSDEETSVFMQDVEIQKKVSSKWKA